MPSLLDGLAHLTFDKLSNRIRTAGFEYDAAGNQRRIVKANGAAHKFRYDPANRMVRVYDDYGYTLPSAAYDATRLHPFQRGSLAGCGAFALH